MNNNLSERMQGTIKERTKVMRGMESPNTARLFLEGFALHYNHMKDHATLKKPPARAAKLPVVFDDWVEVASIQDSDIDRFNDEPLKEPSLKERPILQERTFKPRPLPLGAGTFRTRRGF